MRLDGFRWHPELRPSREEYPVRPDAEVEDYIVRPELDDSSLPQPDSSSLRQPDVKRREEPDESGLQKPVGKRREQHDARSLQQPEVKRM
jgi:hypothetical protein